MIVRKRRGKEELMPIHMSKDEYELAKKFGLPIELYVKERILLIAKQRKWKWYLEKYST